MKKFLLIPTLLAAAVSQTTQAALIEDSTAALLLRNFYLNTDERNEDRPSSKEWGQAFILDFRSGFTEGTVGFGVDVLAQYGIRLDDGGTAGKAGITRTPGSTFPLESDNEAVHDFGRVDPTLKVKVSKTVGQLGTLYPKLPVVTLSNTRLLTQSFEGGQITSKEIDGLTLTGGRLNYSTDRNSSSAERLSIPGANAATGQSSNAFDFLGGDYQVNKDLLLQYYFGNLEDFYAQHFLGLQHSLAVGGGTLKTDLRWFDSDSDGANASAAGRAAGYVSNGYYGSTAAGKAISKGEVDNQIWSAMLTWSRASHSLSTGYQEVNGESDFPHLNQGNGNTPYLITGAQMAKFYSAGEQTWLAGYAYDFASLGVSGLKASAFYYSGRDIDDNLSARKEWERDLRVDYTVPAGQLKGLGLTWRHGLWRGNDVGQRDRDEHQVFINYSLPLL